MSETASCPSCASPVVFRAATTTLAVCAQCGTISARGGATLESVGRTNEVYVTGSVLALGLRGQYANHHFTLIGRTQLAHDSGSVWDEWLVCYDNGRLAWLSEAPWGLSLMGELPRGEGPRLASPFDTTPGASHLTGVGELIVTELGEATIVAEAGELPSRALPGSRRPFVDFTSRTGRCATLDFGAVSSDGTREPKRFFVGRDVSLTELGLGHAKVNPPALPQGQEATALRCPHCSGPLAQPREGTQSLVCRYCNSALSVEGGALALLFAQDRVRHPPTIPLGTRATLEANFFTKARVLGDVPRPWPTQLDVEVIGHLVRSAMIDGVRYTFQEYLLATERDGFFWLVESDGQWSFTRPLDAGLVEIHEGYVVLEDETFSLDQTARLSVEQVLGELTFRVSTHDTTYGSDFRCAPRTLSSERGERELNWSESLDIPTSAVASTFGVTLPFPDEDDSETDLPTLLLIVPVVLLFVLLSVVATCEENDSDDSPSYPTRGLSGHGGYSFGK